MKAYLRPLPLVAAFLFVLHQISQKVLGLSIPFADNYLDNLCCMPLLLPGYALEQRWLWGREKISPFEAILVTFVLSIVFEWTFPRISTRFTADWWDVAAYFTGTLLYLCTRCNPSRSDCTYIDH
ncbi:MAG: hypothetical protein H6563_04325 [Lewinellaceae bacterium]|nr:hypothetical protein [Lewinellaceae bacterium]